MDAVILCQTVILIFLIQLGVTPVSRNVLMANVAGRYDSYPDISISVGRDPVNCNVLVVSVTRLMGAVTVILIYLF